MDNNESIKKKNGQYAGVDEKYVPENERYVNSSLGDEMKNDMYQAYRGAKGYISNKDNQEKIKKAGKKGWGIAKKVGIGYLVFNGLMVAVVIGLFVACAVFIFSQFSGKFGEQESLQQWSNEISSTTFNAAIEMYSGTEYGRQVTILLDEIVTKNKKDNGKSIIVSYDNVETSNPSEIIALKKRFDEWEKYEVIVDYDVDGFIYKVKIEDY